jgi:uncharacterized protein (DUF1501 family)
MRAMNRRHFIQASGLLMASSMLPFSVSAAMNSNPNRTLVLVEFNGGNDSLNMVIPFTDQQYYTLRPSLHIPRNEQIPYTSTLALHPSLRPLVDHIDGGDMGTILGLGYPDPNRSHFRSIEIWDTASRSDETLDSGWLAQPRSDQFLADAIVIGRNFAPVSGNQTRTIVMDNADSFYQKSRNIDRVDNQSQNNVMAHLLKTQNDTKQAAELIKARLSLEKSKLPTFGGGVFGQQLREVARLILIGNTAPVIKVSLGSFDTHQGQKGAQAALFTQFAEGMASFHHVLQSAGYWDDVLVMTYSEFGRRVAENGSGGTDHGTAASHFVFGGGVKGGVYGKQPSLSDLSYGDLKFTTDFRQYYQTVQSGFLGDQSVPLYKPLGFL